MVNQYLSTTDHIIHNTVHDNVGEKIGKISDVLINPESNRPEIAIISEGGLLGLGSDHFAIPFQLLRFNPQSNDVGLKIEAKHVKEAPQVNLDKLRKSDREEMNKLRDFYGESAFHTEESVDSNSYVSERHSNYHHQEYEGSAKITGEEPKTNPDSHPADDMDFEQLKRGKK
ncbi:MAG: PRC-barrel domain-containing protein [Cyclobacteriaceae bacterium]